MVILGKQLDQHLKDKETKKRLPGRPTVIEKSSASMEQICADMRILIRKSSQKYLKRNVDINEVSKEEIDVLCSYLPVKFIVGIFGGNYQMILKDFNYHQKKKDADDYLQAQKDSEDNQDNFVEVEPEGVGGWRYRERLKRKAYRELEKVMNQGMKSGGSQYVNAVKALLTEATKDTEEAVEVMSAYENQILIMASHIVENFLPSIGRSIKNELGKARDEIQERVEQSVKESNDLSVGIRIWRKDFNKFIRKFELKRFELLFAESMAKSKAVNEAFDFSRDLIETFIEKDNIEFDSKDTALLKKHMLNT